MDLDIHMNTNKCRIIICWAGLKSEAGEKEEEE